MIRIDVEGCDGSGKTTMVQRIVELLRAQGKRVLVSREVGNPHIPWCVEMRKLILDPASKLDGRSMELVFSAMRIENERFYDTVKDEYDFLVSDRGWFSHLAYCDVNCHPTFTKSLYRQCMAKETCLADHIIYMHVDETQAAKRRERRGEVVDAIEAKGSAFQRAVATRFEHHFKDAELDTNIIRVDANRPLAEVLGDTKSIVALIM